MSKSFAAARSRPLVELAFAWLLAHPQVISVIAGATTLEQITARRSSGVRLCEGKVDAEAEAKAWPNKGLQLTGNSLRSCLATAIPSICNLALGKDKWKDYNTPIISSLSKLAV
jgi:hypothetical protein